MELKPILFVLNTKGKLSAHTNSDSFSKKDIYKNHISKSIIELSVTDFIQ